MYIDEHVHLRDEEQAYKETIRHGLEVAKMAGVDAVFDIVNTNNPTTTRERIIERLELADKCNLDIFYGLYIGVTKDSKQIEKISELHKEFFPKKGDKFGTIGAKMFAGESVGNLNLSNLDDQRIVYEILSKNNYEGVLALHCGRKDLMKPDLWNPQNPISHCYARPIEAKIKSIKDQIHFALDTNFQGKIHFFHVSSIEEVEYINEVKKNLTFGNNEISNLKVSCEVTPNHLFLPNQLMNQEDGLLLKVNPSLRDSSTASGLLQKLYDGKINTIGTDHAPHTRKEKLEPPYLSGIPCLDLWPRVVRRLKDEEFPEEQISALTFDNQIKLFGLEGIIEKSDNKGDEDLNEYSHLRPEGILEWI